MDHIYEEVVLSEAFNEMMAQTRFKIIESKIRKHLRSTCIVDVTSQDTRTIIMTVMEWRAYVEATYSDWAVQDLEPRAIEILDRLLMTRANELQIEVEYIFGLAKDRPETTKKEV